MAICRECSCEITGPDRYCRKCGFPVAPVFTELDDTRRFNPSAPPHSASPGTPTNPLSAAPSAGYATSKASPPLHKSALLAKLLRPNLVWALIVVMLFTFVFLGIRFGSNMRSEPDRERSSGPGTGGSDGRSAGVGGGEGAGRGGSLGDGSRELGGDRAILPMTASLRPTILYREKAKYTEEARRTKVEGIVVLQVVFHVTGEINDIKVVRGLPGGLTETAVAAAKKIRFAPAEMNGVPVSVRGTLEFTFSLH